MELIKKTILQITTTGSTTGGTIIIPDLTKIYNVKFELSGINKNIGFFDAYTGTTGITTTTTLSYVTGVTTSRLNELRKYVVTNNFYRQYFSGGTTTNDGVDYPNSISGNSVVYYISGIRYNDLLSGAASGTTYGFVSEGTGSTVNFINVPYFKNPNKDNIISNPKIDDDVFIVRQELSAFDKNYRLEFVRNLNDLETYAGGSFFNIVKNS